VLKLSKQRSAKQVFHRAGLGFVKALAHAPPLAETGQELGQVNVGADSQECLLSLLGDAEARPLGPGAPPGAGRHLREVAGHDIEVAEWPEQPAELAQESEESPGGDAGEKRREEIDGGLEPASGDTSVVNGLFLAPFQGGRYQLAQLGGQLIHVGEQAGRRDSAGLGHHLLHCRLRGRRCRREGHDRRGSANLSGDRLKP
jgi:hypothetical protein